LLDATPATLYALAKSNYNGYFHDVTSGGCATLCSAGSRYDYVTGLGTPKADALVAALISQP